MICSRTAWPKACVDVTTTMCFTFVDFLVASHVGRMVKHAISAGIRTVEMTNALVRTRSRYSRRATSQVLRISFAYRINEDLFQGWFHQLEPVDAQPRRRLAQKLLRIRVRRQLDLDMVPE